MRGGVVMMAWNVTALNVVTMSVAVTAHAEPRPEDRFEASGFIGFGWFSDDTELGNSWAPEQVPNTAPVVGGRLGWIALPALATSGDLRLQLAVEAELSIATAFTGGASFAGDDGRMSYFAPVFGWRAHAGLRLAGPPVRPHLIVGVGGETVASSSPYMSKETDPVVYWGPGITVPATERWLVRIDLRHGVMADRDTGMTSTIEVQLGVGATFGAPVRQARAGGRSTPPEQPEPTVGVERDGVEHDSDADGLPDRLDRCPDAREIVNGVDDGDGCPELDADGDGVLAAADQCPDTPEDFDHFEDGDGCPELDNDGDGFDDGRDTCPREPETRNGFDDTDGCPDTVADDVTKALAAGGRVKFEPGRARITPASRAALAPLLAMLVARPDIHIAVVGRPETARGDALAKRRAEAVKWMLVDAGITEDRIEAKVGTVGKPLIELALVPH